MNLIELLIVVRESSADEWEVMPSDIGETIRPRIENSGNEILVGSYTHSASFSAELSISMAFGMTLSSNVTSPWIQAFSIRNSEKKLATIYYNGTPVYRFQYLDADGGRLCLPIPDDSMSVSRDIYELVRLVHRHMHGDTYEEGFAEAKIHIRE